ncbi:MAG TPA: DUF4124 domain-containing protein [Marinagarivorans sp.]
MCKLLFVAVKVAVALSLLISGAATADIYRCKDAKGKLQFSDQPCGDTAEKVVIEHAPTYSAEHDSDRWRTISNSNDTRDIERAINRHQRAIARYRSTMTSKLSELAMKKATAANNLAGANWELSLSKEMDVVENHYSSLIASEQNEIEFLRQRLLQIMNPTHSSPVDNR